jgi:hypothetical protein
VSSALDITLNVVGFEAKHKKDVEAVPSATGTFRFLSLPPEIRDQIYELAIFPAGGPDIFIFNSRLQLSLLRVNRAVAHEASRVLYTRRTAVIAFLPHHFYVNGRNSPVYQLFRADVRDDTSCARRPDELPRQLSCGHVYPHVLARFARIRLCSFFPTTFRTEYPLVFFDPIAELKGVLEALREHSSSPFQYTCGSTALEIIVAVYPKSLDAETETPREARVTEDFVRRGITRDLKEIRTRRSLKVGGNFSREGALRFCMATCGD